MDILITVFILSNSLTILFLLQMFAYMIYTYFALWKKKKIISLQYVKDIAKAKSTSLPNITVIIPAKNESDVIASSIDLFMRFNYPHENFNVLIVLDDKELEGRPFAETTHGLVRQKEEYYNQLYGRKIVSSTSVHKNFNGKYNGKIISQQVPSTKPRALNWALNYIPEETDIVGFYDADSRPDLNTLIYVAYRYLQKQGKPILLQGSLIQTRNYNNLKILNKIYALAQGLTHEFFYPTILKHLPFIGGTNFFISLKILRAVKGFNRCCVSEDLDLGCRLYLNLNVWPEFMPYVATEQTPLNYKDYFNQRSRWSKGFLQVMSGMLMKNGNLVKRFYLFSMLIFYGILPWGSSLIVIFSGFIMLFLPLLRGPHMLDFAPFEIKLTSIFLNLIYLCLIFLYFRYAMEKFYIPRKELQYKLFFRYCELLIFPVAAILGGIPYTYGFFINFISKKQAYPVWEKTKRSKEIV